MSLRLSMRSSRTSDLGGKTAKTSESGPGPDLASLSDMADWLSLFPGSGRAEELAVESEEGALARQPVG